MYFDYAFVDFLVKKIFLDDFRRCLLTDPYRTQKESNRTRLNNY